jgi:hypothetical protein
VSMHTEVVTVSSKKIKTKTIRSFSCLKIL